MFNIVPIIFAVILAMFDTLTLAWMKEFTVGTVNWTIIPFGMLLYSLQPLIFLQSLKHESMTVMNILWDIISDFFVTATGLIYFKERLSTMKMVGLSFAGIAIILLSYDELYNKRI